MSNFAHEFEERKLAKGTKCGDCHGKLPGLLKVTGFQCRNCLSVLCKKCRGKPENSSGCGSNLTQAAPKQSAEPDPVMEFYIKYVKRNANGEMVVRGLPPEWKQLFKDAGVKPRELKDPKTASWLIGLMNDILSGKVTSSAPSAAPAEEELRVQAVYDFAAVEQIDLSFKRGDVIVVLRRFETGWAEGQIGDRTGHFPYNYVVELPPEPRAAPAVPPPRVDSGGGGDDDEGFEAEAAPVAAPIPIGQMQHQQQQQQQHHAAPPAAAPEFQQAPVAAAPPPPPPAPMATGPKPPPPPAPVPASAPVSSGPKPPPPPPAAAAKPAAAGNGLADAIAAGTAGLRKVADNPQPKKELSQLTANERSNMLDIISAAMNARRKDIDETKGDDDDNWDDWDDD